MVNATRLETFLDFASVLLRFSTFVYFNAPYALLSF